MDAFLYKKILHSVVNHFVLFSPEQMNLVVESYLEKVGGSFVILDCDEIPKFIKGKTEVTYELQKELASKGEFKIIYYVEVEDPELEELPEYGDSIYHILKNNLKAYELYDIAVYNHTPILRYRSKDREYVPVKRNITVINLLYGVGDFFLLSSIYYELIRQHKEKGNTVYIEFFERKDELHSRTKDMCELFFQSEASYICFQNKKLHTMLMENKENLIFPLIDINDGIRVEHEHPDHIVNMVQEYLWQGKLHISPYKYEDTLKKILRESLSKEEKDLVDCYCKKNHKLIGIQFYSGKYMEKQGIWQDETPKNWDIKNVLKFCKLCKENNIELVNLSPNPYMDVIKDYVIALPQMSLVGYIYLISKLYYLVGIDSSANHIAAFYNIPHLTLWWNQLVHRQAHDINTNWCFRSLRNDYSLVPVHEFMINEMDVKEIFETFLQGYKGILPHSKGNNMDIQSILTESMKYI